MKRIFLIAIALLLIASCGTLTKHFTQRGTLEFSGGLYKSKTWSDSLEFDRVTWYREFTTMYDLAWTKIDIQSPFFSWFSAEERSKIRESLGPCYIALAYYEDSDKISTSMLMEQLREQGMKKININRFSKYLKIHPQAGAYSLQQYKVYGLCTSSDKKSIKIDFPGFSTIKIK
ncbi:MAG: hypothetical protein KAG61_03960 [Bacteriovoracaceae bacterium]|nr:hypothetical protein [Bacteriovoracaceae bacterium]